MATFAWITKDNYCFRSVTDNESIKKLLLTLISQVFKFDFRCLRTDICIGFHETLLLLEEFRFTFMSYSSTELIWETKSNFKLILSSVADNLSH